MPDSDQAGSSEPTVERVDTARRLRDFHQRDEDGGCWWCGYTWPCPDERLTARILRRAAAAE